MRKLLIGAGLLLAATSATAAECYDLTITDSASITATQSDWTRNTQPEYLKLCDGVGETAYVHVVSNGATIPAFRNAPGVYTVQMNGATATFTLRADGVLLHTQSNVATEFVLAAKGEWK